MEKAAGHNATVSATLAPGGTSPRRFKWSLLLGFDVFISYRRGPHASAYIRNLQNALHAEGLTCFVDQEETEGGEQLGAVIQRSIRRSRTLVVLAEPRVVDSQWVAKEIVLFRRKPRRKIIPISIDDFLMPDEAQPEPFDHLQSVSWLNESGSAFEDGQPSEAVVGGVRAAFNRFRVKTLSRMITTAVMVILALFAGTAWLQQREAVQQSQIAEQRRQVAQSRQLALQSANHLDEDFDLAMLLAVESATTLDTAEARAALVTGFEHHRFLTAWMHPDVGFSTSGKSLAFSPNGQLLAASGNVYPIVLWDVPAKRTIAPALQSDGLRNVLALDFSPDSKLIAGGDEGGAVQVWDVASQQALGQVLKHEHAVQGIAFSPDAKTLAVATCRPRNCDQKETGEIRLWDTTHFQPAAGSPPPEQTRGVRCIAFSPDGGLLAWGDSNGAITLWDLSRGEPVGAPIETELDAVRFITFSPDGTLLVAVNEHGVFGRWRLPGRAQIDESRELSGHPHLTFFMGTRDVAPALSNLRVGDGVPFRRSLGGDVWAAHLGVMAAPHRGGILLWQHNYHDRATFLGNPAEMKVGYPTSWTHENAVHNVFPDGATVAVAGPTGKVSIKPLHTDEETRSWDTGIKDITSITISPDGTRIAVAGCAEMFRPDGNERRRGLVARCLRSRAVNWMVADGEIQDEAFEDHDSAVMTMMFDEHGDTLLSFGRDGSRVARDLDSNTVRKADPIDPALNLEEFAVSPDQEMVIASAGIGITHRSRVLLWAKPFQTDRAPRAWDRNGRIYSLAFHPRDGSVVIGGGGGNIQRWQPDAISNTSVLQAGSALTKSATYEVSALALSPDGRLLASESDQGFIIWDLEAGQPLITRRGAVEPLTFSHDGQTLIAGDRAFDLNLTHWQRRACDLVNRNLTWAEWDLYVGDDNYRPVCPHIALAPADLVAYANALVARDRLDRLPPILAQATVLAADRGPPVNDEICRTGGLFGFGETVLPACDRAVALCQKDFVCARYRDRRAVARAQSGALADAASDLEASIGNMLRLNASQERLTPRNEWLHVLHAGRNPFNAEVLEQLRFE